MAATSSYVRLESIKKGVIPMEARLTQASNKQLSKLIVSNLAGTLGSAILTFVIGLIIDRDRKSVV